MFRQIALIFGLVGAVLLTLTACGGGTGIDTQLSKKSEQDYHVSLQKAWEKMTPEQQEAFNWAVSNYTLAQLMGKYKTLTPRNVIKTETDAYIVKKTQELASLTKDYKEAEPMLIEQDKVLAEVTGELKKITAVANKLTRDDFFRDLNFHFTSSNQSRFDLSGATWETKLLINDEQDSDRTCNIRGYYKIDGGLRSGSSKKTSYSLGFDCSDWDTLEVKNAKNIRFVMKLDHESVRDFAEKSVLPHYEVKRSDYERALAETKEELEAAAKIKLMLK